jgi:hypothetical protein
MKFSPCWISYVLFFFITVASARDWLVDKITDATTLTKTPSGTLPIQVYYDVLNLKQSLHLMVLNTILVE